MKKSEKTKQKILDETINLIAKQGYASTSTREIAKKAEISEATIFKYYQSKDNLLKTIVMETMEKLFESSSEEKIPTVFKNNKNKAPEMILKSLIKERLNFFTVHNKELKVVFQEMLINKNVQKYFKEEIWPRMVEISNQIFDQIKAEYELKAEMDNYMFRKSLFGMLFFTILFEEILEEDQAFDNQKQADLITDIIFSGISEKKHND
jgi:AcrR family transcriptional regulator